MRAALLFELLIPEHWTPEQALLAADLLADLQEALWAVHGPAIAARQREYDQALAELDDEREGGFPYLDEEIPF
ncbi:MAG: hypothetical protein EDX89_24430 [Acidobacteria bacterium]|nr:MAG: hypothetical protein EDX89_24430 [Acidobacteriota bacterium]